MEPIIKVGNFAYEQDDKGNWTFKALDPKPIKKKPEYKELPAFDIINDIDAHMQGQMDNEIKAAKKEIVNLLKSDL